MSMTFAHPAGCSTSYHSSPLLRFSFSSRFYFPNSSSDTFRLCQISVQPHSLPGQLPQNTVNDLQFIWISHSIVRCTWSEAVSVLMKARVGTQNCAMNKCVQIISIHRDVFNNTKARAHHRPHNLNKETPSTAVSVLLDSQNKGVSILRLLNFILVLFKYTRNSFM